MKVQYPVDPRRCPNPSETFGQQDFLCWFLSLGWLTRFDWTTLWFLSWFPSGSRTSESARSAQGSLFSVMFLCVLLAPGP